MGRSREEDAMAKKKENKPKKPLNKPYKEEDKKSAKMWFGKKQAERIIRALKKNGFDAEYFLTREQAAKRVLDLAASAQTIGVGGSVTIRELKILDVLREQGKTVLDHWTGIPPGEEEDMRIRMGHLTCDLFLTSTNALTLKGEIVNMDGAGNRTNAMSFGPKKVVFIVGSNKIVRNIDEGIQRIHDVVAPQNVRRAGYVTVPCYETGICSPSAPGLHVCCITLILNRKPMLTDVSVYLVEEELGF
jgi:L-lactate utilization protein LutC